MSIKEIDRAIAKFERDTKKIDKEVAESNKRFDYHFNRIMQML